MVASFPAKKTEALRTASERGTKLVESDRHLRAAQPQQQRQPGDRITGRHHDDRLGGERGDLGGRPTRRWGRFGSR